MPLYFLIVACLQLVPFDLAPVSPLTTWVPLGAVVALTAARDAADDIGRARADAAANARLVRVVRRGRTLAVPAAAVRVGDLLRLVDGEEVPADAVLLATHAPAGTAWVDTASLDGESALKRRDAPRATRGLPLCGGGRGGGGRAGAGGGGRDAGGAGEDNVVDVDDDEADAAAGALEAAVEVGPPSEALDAFDGAITVGAGGRGRAPLGPAALLPAGSVLRATRRALALVVYVGAETKVGLSRRPAPGGKTTRVDARVSRLALATFAAQLCLVAALGAAGAAAAREWGVGSWYLGWSPAERAPGALAFALGVLLPARFLLLLSTMIPLSLKVTLDAAKTLYARGIARDEAADDEGGGGAAPRTTALAEDLGCVTVIVTDKTGTLTRNRMLFAGAHLVGGERLPPAAARPEDGGGPPAASVEGVGEAAAADADAGAGAGAFAASWVASPGGVSAESPATPAAAPAPSPSPASAPAPSAPAPAPSPPSPAAAAFWLALALCNDVTPTDGAFVSASPDEEELVRAAAAAGTALVARAAEGASVRVRASRPSSSSPRPPAAAIGAPVLYETVAVLEFTPERKRSSVLVRSPGDGALTLYCKGADDVLLPRLDARAHAPGALERARAAVDAFAASGLRTLLVARRAVTDAELAAWRAAHAAVAAAATPAARAAAAAAAAAQLERGLLLLGASAVEDALAVGVPDAVRRLHAAGVKLVMATGDKLSTAVAVAGAAGLVAPGALVVPLEEEEEEEEEGDDDGSGGGDDGRARDGDGGGGGGGGGGVGGGAAAGDEEEGGAGARAGAGASAGAGAGSGARARRAAAAARLLRALTSATAAASSRPPGSPFVLVVAGSTLERALGGSSAALALAAGLALAADAVVACRATPRNKAALVALFKRAGHVTLAVGDGGNDVAMIQEASVGVGLAGREGSVAARAADYALPRFASLPRLLLVHGRAAARRTTAIASFSFFKSLLFCAMQAGFAAASGAAGGSLFDGLAVAGVNVVLFLPILALALDLDVAPATALAVPAAYAPERAGAALRLRQYLAAAAAPAAAAAALLLGAALAGTAGGASADIYSAGVVAFNAYLLAAAGLLLLVVPARVTPAAACAVIGCYALYLAAAVGAGASRAGGALVDFGAPLHALADPACWLVGALGAVAVVGPAVLARAWAAAEGDTLEDRVRRLDAARVGTRAAGALVAGGGGGGGDAGGEVDARGASEWAHEGTALLAVTLTPGTATPSSSGGSR